MVTQTWHPSHYCLAEVTVVLGMVTWKARHTKSYIQYHVQSTAMVICYSDVITPPNESDIVHILVEDEICGICMDLKHKPVN